MKFDRERQYKLLLERLAKGFTFSGHEMVLDHFRKDAAALLRNTQRDFGAASDWEWKYEKKWLPYVRGKFDETKACRESAFAAFIPSKFSRFADPPRSFPCDKDSCRYYFWTIHDPAQSVFRVKGFEVKLISDEVVTGAFIVATFFEPVIGGYSAEEQADALTDYLNVKYR